MNISDVTEEIVGKLGAITGLRAFPFSKGSINPPAALVMPPEEINYDVTYGRGMDRVKLDVIVIVGKSDERSAYAAARAYADGRGPRSIKQALESSDYENCHTVQVVSATVDELTNGGTDYLAMIFSLDITGQGA